jgi:signal transduction histidine kinase
LTQTLDKGFERTTVLYDPKDIVNSAIEMLCSVKDKIDICADHNAPSSHVELRPVWNAFSELRSKNVKVRFITEITKENISYSKQLMKIVELRHLDEIMGNFGIVDGIEYRASPTSKEGRPPPEYVISTVKTIVEQQYFFDMLWRKAMPSKERIKEIEQGLEHQFIETIQDPIETQKLCFQLVKSARQEILIVFPTPNEFHRQEQTGIIRLLKELPSTGIRIRILTPMDDRIKQREQLFKEQNIDIRYIEEILQTKVTMLLVDRRLSLAAELKNDTKDNYYEATGLATYSNSESTISSYASIFESLWRQVDLYDELKIRDIAQKEFINIAAHELRNPIQPILGLSQVLRSKKEEGRKGQEELLDAIIRNAKRLQRLAEDVLDAARIGNKSLKLNKERFNLDEILSNAVKDYGNQIEKVIDSKMKITYVHADIFIEADKGRITQVICNLLSNAAKFTTEGSIMVSTERKSSQIVISIKDTGTGIDSEILPKLFTKFATKSEAGGTGLGLFISKSIIEAHGGRIWAENNSDGKGATFYFSLPLSR